jgi:site-specific recombinase XerD
MRGKDLDEVVQISGGLKGMRERGGPRRRENARKAGIAQKIARAWGKRYEVAFGRAFPGGTGELQRAVGELLGVAPDREGLVREILELAMEEAARKNRGGVDLEPLVRAVQLRRDLLVEVVARAVDGDRRLGHAWFAGLGASPEVSLVNAVLHARFKLELKAQNRRPRTVAAYLAGIERLSAFLAQGRRSLLEATPDDIRAFKARLMSAKQAPATVNARLAAVKSLCRLLVREKLTDHAILEAFEALPVEKRIRTRLDAGEVERLLAVIDEGTPIGLRDAAYLRMLFATAARVGELTHLRVADVDLARGEAVFLSRKNREDHLALVPPVALGALRRYLDRGRPALLEKAPTSSARPELLFLSRRGGPFYRANVSERLKRYARAAGITKRVTTHVFRRSVATVLAEAGMPPELIRIFLGHRRLSSTLGAYVQYSRATLRANLERFHPWFLETAAARAAGAADGVPRKQGPNSSEQKPNDE